LFAQENSSSSPKRSNDGDGCVLPSSQRSNWQDTKRKLIFVLRKQFSSPLRTFVLWFSPHLTDWLTPHTLGLPFLPISCPGCDCAHYTESVFRGWWLGGFLGCFGGPGLSLRQCKKIYDLCCFKSKSNREQSSWEALATNYFPGPTRGWKHEVVNGAWVQILQKRRVR